MKKTFLVITILLLSITAFTQSRTITGVVLNKASNTALAGVTVTAKNKMASTDSSGKFSIEAAVGDDIGFSYVGMQPQTVRIRSGDQRLSVEMEETSDKLGEIVVTGYQVQRKVDLTGAVSVVRVSDVANIPSSNLVTSLQGRIPGVFIEADGRPNGGQNNLLIRGVSTLGNTSPLFVIDGVSTLDQTAFRNLDPNLIESVQVLKDATSASIYGSRASNGVVIVTTKQGKDKLRVNFSSSYGKNYFTDKVPVLDVYGRGRALWQAAINDKIDPAQNAAVYGYDWHRDANGVAVLDKVTPVQWVGGSPAGLTPGANTDWQDVVFHTGTVADDDLSISYGNKNASGLMGFNYLDNQGIMQYMQFRRYGARINTAFNFLDGKVKVGENFQVTYTRNSPDRLDLGGSNMVNLARFEQPLLPVYKTNGDWAGPIGAGFSDRNNPLHMLYIYRNNFDKTLGLFGNIYAEVRPVQNLLLRSVFGLDYTEGYSSAIYPAFVTGFLSRTINYMTVDQFHRPNWTWTNTANYLLKFGPHNINLLAGMEAIKNRYQTLSAYKEGFAIEDLNYYQLGAGTGNQTNSGSLTGNQLLSYFGKVNYNYGDKYLLAVTIRQDGSSRFGENNQYGVFPSVAAGWRLSNESFLQNMKSISNLKLRAGWGRVGNQEIGDESRFGSYATNYGALSGGRRNIGTAYDLTGSNGGTLASGYSQVRRENLNLKWETTEEVNIGLDFGFMQDKLFGTFDYFKRRTTDILITPPYPAIIGAGASQVLNGATVDNKGFELSLGYRDRTAGGLTYNIGVNVGGFRNKVVYVPASVVAGYPGNVEKTILGHAPQEMFGYIVQGLFQTQEEVDKSAAQPGKGIGRIRYADLNGDGKIDALDQDWLGNQLPKAEYGLNIQLGYKGFDLALFGQGIYGRKVNNVIKGSTDFLQSGMNMGSRVLDAWTPQNKTSTIPMLSNANSNNETRFSSYYVESGDYFKLRTAELGYAVPQKLIDRARIQHCRVFVLGGNLFTIFRKGEKDSFTAMDPALPGSTYPVPTSVTFGLNLTL
ncbi:MAG: TonB-dependent receptor [Williamsia sp.]|nr:TonB-dependent receptor [Williamsia sp.]